MARLIGSRTRLPALALASLLAAPLAQAQPAMIEHGVGVRTARVIELKRVDEDYFTGDD